MIMTTTIADTPKYATRQRPAEAFIRQQRTAISVTTGHGAMGARKAAVAEANRDACGRPVKKGKNRICRVGHIMNWRRAA